MMVPDDSMTASNLEEKTKMDATNAEVSTSNSSMNVSNSSFSAANTSLGSGSQGSLALPVQRIKMIMKSCPDVESVQQESLQTVARATELFIAHLAKESFKKEKQSHRLDYDSLSDLVNSSSKLEFLIETVPGKITWAECQKLMSEKKNTIGDYV